MKTRRLRRILQHAGLTLHGMPRRFRRGMTGSWLWLARVQGHPEWGEVVVKYHADPTFITREYEQHDVIRAFFGDIFVRCYARTEHFLVLEFIDNGHRDGVKNLSELLRDASVDRTRVRRALQFVFKNIARLWEGTHRQLPQGQPTLYTEIMDAAATQYPTGRTSAYLAHRFRQHPEQLRLPILANGEQLPMSLAEAAEWIHAELSRPRTERWATHGDLKGDNILIHEDGTIRLIDPREKVDDWVNDLAILSRTRNLQTAQRCVGRKVRVENGHLVLNSETQFSPLCEVITEQCFVFGSETATRFNDRDWEVRYWTHVGAAYFNEMQFYYEREGWGVVPRFPYPEAFLFAEGVRAILRAQTAAEEARR